METFFFIFCFFGRLWEVVAYQKWDSGVASYDSGVASYVDAYDRSGRSEKLWLYLNVASSTRWVHLLVIATAFPTKKIKIVLLEKISLEKRWSEWNISDKELRLVTAVTSQTFSSVGIHDVAKWQFCSTTQVPSLTAFSIMRMAIGPCPWPNDNELSLDPLKPCGNKHKTLACLANTVN